MIGWGISSFIFYLLVTGKLPEFIAFASQSASASQTQASGINPAGTQQINPAGSGAINTGGSGFITPGQP